MKNRHTLQLSILSMILTSFAFAQEPIKVSPKNFVRAESDAYFAGQVQAGGFGKLVHTRELAPVNDQKIIRLNRDTLYSAGVFDLDAGPVTVTMPDSGKRFMSMQVISEDHFTSDVVYDKGSYTFDKSDIGTRYVFLGFRTFVDPLDVIDIQAAQTLQNAIKVNQPHGMGKFEMPKWDSVSQKKVHDALISLNDTLPDTNGMFGKKNEVDPILHLIGSASGWGGNPEKDATYLNITPDRNDGRTVHRLSVKDVPVDGFWSISVYNKNGYYEPNSLNRYTLNNVTAQKNTDGTIDVQFGDCTQKTPNCLPIVNGWNYMVRLYRPQSSILNGTWVFPKAKPIN